MTITVPPGCPRKTCQEDYWSSMSLEGETLTVMVSVPRRAGYHTYNFTSNRNRFASFACEALLRYITPILSHDGFSLSRYYANNWLGYRGMASLCKSDALGHNRIWALV